MAAKSTQVTPEGNGDAERLDRIIELLEIQNTVFGQLADTMARYAPALDKAAALVDSPAAKLAAKLPRPRRGGGKPWEGGRML